MRCKPANPSVTQKPIWRYTLSAASTTCFISTEVVTVDAGNGRDGLNDRLDLVKLGVAGDAALAALGAGLYSSQLMDTSTTTVQSEYSPWSGCSAHRRRKQ